MFVFFIVQPARWELADGAPTSGKGEDFLTGQQDFFKETDVTLERKVEKSFLS